MKIYFVKTFFTSFLLIFSAIFLPGFSNGGGPILTLGTATVDGDGNGPIVQIAPNGCTLDLTFTVQLSNLHLFDPDELEIGDGDGFILIDYFPEGEGHPDLYFEYYLEDGPIVRVPLTEFQFNEETQLYEVNITTYSINISNQCARVRDGGYFVLNYNGRLVTTEENDQGNTTYIPYPVCEYMNAGDIFDHQIPPCFDSGSNNSTTSLSTQQKDIRENYAEHNTNMNSRTDDGGINCGGGLPSPWSILVYCNNCSTDGPIPNEGGSEGPGDEGEGLNNPEDEKSIVNFRDQEAKLVSSLSTVSVQPNPFINNLNIQWSEKEPLSSIELYDVNGVQIDIWKTMDLKSTTSLNINTSTLANGIYLIKVTSTGATEVIKVLKQ